MKSHLLPAFLTAFALIMNGCGNVFTGSSPTESPVAQDKASLIAALQASGTTMEAGDSITQAFFSPVGSIIKVNGADVQVFEYESAEAMEIDASQVAPDGGSIGTSMVMWVDAPHFYKAGRIIVLYVGGDQTILDLLEKAMGPQFAGR